MLLENPAAFVPTRNLKLAATLVAFEVPLRRHDPTFVADVWADKARTQRTGQIVVYNFVAHDAVRALARAFAGQGAEARFAERLAKLPVSAAEKQLLAAEHSDALAQCCREVLNARDSLEQLRRATPKESQWDVIREREGGPTLLCGKNANPEMLNLW